MATKPCSMTSIALLLPLLLLLLLLPPCHLPHAATAADSVEATCKTIAGGDSRNVLYAFCVEALRSDPASGAADTKGLAVIATKLSEKNATSMEALATAWLRRSQRRPERQSLKECVRVYGNAAARLRVSVGAIEQGRLDDAMTYLTASAGAVDMCAMAFEETRVRCPFPKEHEAAYQLCGVALSITHLLE